MLGTLKKISLHGMQPPHQFSLVTHHLLPHSLLNTHYQVMIGPAAELVTWSGEVRYAYHALSHETVLLMIPEL